MQVDDAEGAILAHSLALQSGPIRKGTVLDASALQRIKADGLSEVVAVRLEAGDLSENEAAERVGSCLTSNALVMGPVFTGRVNILADSAGVVRVDTAAVFALNAVDEGLTLATLPDFMRVAADQLVATVKVIPYGIDAQKVEEGLAALGKNALALHPFEGGKARLILTQTPGFKESLLVKGEAVVKERVEALGFSLQTQVVAHDEESVAGALSNEADLHLILGASATSDRADVAPSAVVRAGGRIDRFGMPVDPGNLLFLGELKGVPVVGLPGCARSPALNGVDWVLERLAAGIPVDSDAIAAMGVGGLLKEMQERPHPRRPRS